jgi:hypothetical protein
MTGEDRNSAASSEAERIARGRPVVAAIRKHLRKIWSTGGGGYYGVGYLCMFVWLEVQLLVDDVLEASGFVDFVSNAILSRIFSFFIESLINAVLSAIWPLILFKDTGWAWGVVILLVTYGAYNVLLRPILGEWLGFDLAEKNEGESR